MKVNEYAARAAQDIRNVATHHDTPAEAVEAELDKLIEYAIMLKAGLPKARAAYAQMRDEEAKAHQALRVERLAKGVK